MTRTVVTLVFWLMMSWVASTEQPVGPKLLVVIVVDQMRADYLTTFNQHWKRGFRTMLEEGAVFDRAAYPYLNAWTCAGHATISTGTLPRTHGMILNRWWHREERRNLECTADEAFPDITYGRPVTAGNSAKRLLVPTLSDELRTQRPGSRVVALSLKARSAIGLAGHGGDVVSWFDDTAGSFATSKAFAAGPVEAMRDFVTRDPYEKDQGRTWTLLEAPATYRFEDAGLGERPPQPWNGLFPHRIAGRAPLDALFFDVWQTSPFADAYLERMAAAMIDELTLGQRNQTDYLGVSFSALDEVGHDFGPQSREVEDLLRRLDVTMGSLIGHLDARVGRQNYVLALTADHGIVPIARPGTGGRIVVEDIRERLEETLVNQFGPLDNGSYVEAAAYQNVFLAPGIFDRLRSSPAVMRVVEGALMNIPGVARILRSDQLSERSSDALVRAAALSHVPGRSGDLIVVPKEYWSVNERNAVSAVNHGTPYWYDTQVPMILLGGAIKPGRISAQVSPADIAPTLAYLAGVQMPKAEGRVLREALR